MPANTARTLPVTTLSWWQLELDLRWQLAHQKTRPGEVLAAVWGLFKGVAARLPQADRVIVSFALRHGALWHATLTQGSVLPLVVRFGNQRGAAAVQAWISALVRHLDRTQHDYGWSLQDLQSPTLCQAPLPAPATDAGDGGLCDYRLHCISPLPFRPAGPAQRQQLDGASLRELIARQIERWFGADVARMLPEGALRTFCGDWHYAEMLRQSASAKALGRDAAAQPHLINGCMGSLIVRASSTWEPWLRVLESTHLVARDQHGSIGQFLLQSAEPGAVDAALGDVMAAKELAVRLLRTSDIEPGAATPDGDPLPLEDLPAALATALSLGTYVPQPTQRIELAKEEGGTRVIERLQAFDLIAQRRLADVLQPHVDIALSDAAVAYRRGVSRQDTLQRVHAAIAQGARYGVLADIADFFPSVDHARLLAQLDDVLPFADRVTRELVRRVLSMPSRTATGETESRSHGLPQGSPLSPLLANLYLAAFDHRIRSAGVLLLRYADDMLLLCKTRSEAESALARVTELLGGLGMHLHGGKTRVFRVDEGFEYLGERVLPHADSDPITSFRAQRKPLVLSDPFLMLGVNGDAFEVRRDKQLVATLPVRRISEVIILNRAALSTTVVDKCCRLDIPLAIALEGGYQMAMLSAQSRKSHQIAHQQAVRYEQMPPHARQAIAAEIVAAKIDNYIAWLRSAHRPEEDAVVRSLNRVRADIALAQSVEALRGYEASAARLCWTSFRARVRADQRATFASTKRARGAPDRLNSVLNLGYYLLFIRLSAMLKTTGCNPYLGYLHDGSENYETLVYDLAELFRVHVDRTVLRLINRRELCGDDFAQTGSRFPLASSGIRKLCLAWEDTLGSACREGLLRDIMAAQVRALARFVADGHPLWLYRWAPARSGGGSADAAVAHGEEAADEHHDEDDQSATQRTARATDEDGESHAALAAFVAAAEAFEGTEEGATAPHAGEPDSDK